MFIYLYIWYMHMFEQQSKQLFTIEMKRRKSREIPKQLQHM